MNRSESPQMSPATEMALTVLREFDQQIPEGDVEGLLQRDSAVFQNLGATSVEIHEAFTSLIARRFIEEVGGRGYRITPAGRNLARSQSFQDYLLSQRHGAEKQGRVDEAAQVPSRPTAPEVPMAPPTLRSRSGWTLSIGAIVVLTTLLVAAWFLVRPNQALLDPQTLASPKVDADGCVAILYSEWKLIEKGGEHGIAAASVDERIKTKLQALNTSKFELEVNWKETEEARQLQRGCLQACKLYMAATTSNSPSSHERDALFGSVKDCLDRLINPQSKHYELKLDVGGNGKGSIANGQNGRCEGRCTEAHRAQDTVLLQATPRSSSRFVGWVGDCKGTGPCQFVMDANKTVTAVFEDVVQPVKMGCRDAYISQEHSSWVIECQCDGKTIKTSGAFPSTHQRGSSEFLRAADARKKRDAWTCP